MNIVIVEDEALNAEQLLFYIKKYDAGIAVEAMLKSNKEMEAWFAANPAPSLLFCDIQLLDGNVFASLQKGIVSCPIIFTTAYDQFYQNAFDTNGIAYLLKPFSYASFESAMNKFSQLTSPQATVDWGAVSSLIRKMNTRHKERIAIKTASDIKLIEVRHIMCFTAHSGVCIAVDFTGRKYEFRQKFSDLADELDPDIFFQISRGEIVNINYIEAVKPYFNDRLSVKLKN
ncbi:MAG TPA: LytTR family DNA-binding domain-containing protein, partial [Flavobacterium sp.]|nr:LytTR family DNA-binding domain-containing protein [Flavobacterium sp.]